MTRRMFQGAWIGLAVLAGYMFAWWILNVASQTFGWPPIILCAAVTGALFGAFTHD